MHTDVTIGALKAPAKGVAVYAGDALSGFALASVQAARKATCSRTVRAARARPSGAWGRDDRGRARGSKNASCRIRRLRQTAAIEFLAAFIKAVSPSTHRSPALFERPGAHGIERSLGLDPVRPASGPSVRAKCNLKEIHRQTRVPARGEAVRAGYGSGLHPVRVDTRRKRGWAAIRQCLHASW